MFSENPSLKWIFFNSLKKDNFVLPVHWMKTYILFCLLIWNGLPCGTPKHFEVLETITEKIIPGRRESPSYVQYKVVLVTARNSERLEFLHLWVNKKSISLKIHLKNRDQSTKEFGRGDTLLLYATLFPGIMEAEEEKRCVPEEVKKAASPVLEYTLGKKKNYREILFDTIETQVNR